jgi:CheY-like chemotaxis protein
MMNAPEPGLQPSEATAPLILIVDDSLDARMLYSEFLEFCGFRVITAENGEKGVAAARAEWPAVILMDLAMPVVDGWEAIHRLRADPMTSEIPIVALSAYAFGDEPERAREAGADLCLSKPCLPSQVARVVRAMLFRVKAHHPVPTVV